MQFQISLAGRIIEVNSLYDYVYRKCRDYWTAADHNDLTVTVTPEHIAYEREKSEITNPGYGFSDSYLEMLAVYRQIARGMLQYNTFLMHGTVIAYDGGAYMITAASGTGKTTLSEFWLDSLEGSYVVNGDKPLIHVTPEGVLACGTPWSGKENRDTNCMVPLKGIFLLSRGEENRVQEVPFLRAVPVLLQQSYRTEEAQVVEKTMDLLCTMAQTVRFFRTTMQFYPSRAEIDSQAMVQLFRRAIG